MLRTDRGALRSIHRDSDATIELRALVNLRGTRVEDRTAQQCGTSSGVGRH
jgi:hypothetical protein